MRLTSHLCTNMESLQSISVGSRRILGEFRQIFDTLTGLKEYKLETKALQMLKLWEIITSLV